MRHLLLNLIGRLRRFSGNDPTRDAQHDRLSLLMEMSWMSLLWGAGILAAQDRLGRLARSAGLFIWADAPPARRRPRLSVARQREVRSRRLHASMRREAGVERRPAHHTDTTRTRPAANLSTSLSGSGNSGFTPWIKRGCHGIDVPKDVLRLAASTVVTLPPAPTPRDHDPQRIRCRARLRREPAHRRSPLAVASIL